MTASYVRALEQARSDVPALARSCGVLLGVYEAADLVTFVASLRVALHGTEYQRAHYAAAAEQAAQSFVAHRRCV